ncbi:hypothetical protein BDN72DRAFT_843836 [Pluteus cervinus]|uniref:Uncharacterized protein n=1 Tax=Pluteus cervinus TaxID=181527 RepID=A0ACD3AMI8_9AGAR|nr:hypothetical protein BDN72DRAFT_843836 [Pluteus cervinus]
MHQIPFAHNPEAKDLAIQRLDDEIRSLTIRLCLLKSQRNTFTITSSLPDELLGEIFAIVQTACKDIVSGLSSPSSELQAWLPITHVSRHWRKVALESSQLWCQIDALPEPAIREFLVRSAGRRLFVNIIYQSPSGCRYSYSEDLLGDIFAHTSHIEKLSIRSRKHFDQVLPHITSTPAPQLKELRISGSFGLADDIHLPNDLVLFQGTTPLLNTLSLFKCHFNLNFPLFGNGLTTLEITRCPMGSTTDWLTLLKQMPRLSTLSLRFSFTEGANVPESVHIPIPKDFGVVPLLELCRLDIQGSRFEADLGFLAHIAFPSRTSLQFSSRISRIMTNEELSKSPLAAFVRVYDPSRPGVSQIEISGLKLEELVDLDEGPDGIPITASTLIFSAKQKSQSYITFCISGLEAVNCDETYVAAIRSLPVSHLTSLTINCGVKPEAFSAFSNLFSDLQEVSCSGDAIQPFLMQLQVAQLMFVSLKSVHIGHASLGYIEAALTSAISARRQNGLPVKKVGFSFCTQVTDDFVSRLQSLVEVVDCYECNPGDGGWAVDEGWDREPLSGF